MYLAGCILVYTDCFYHIFVTSISIIYDVSMNEVEFILFGVNGLTSIGTRDLRDVPLL